ncbi:PQQ-dependent sugar dehydrogenase [Candidatus Nitrotoga arctica]|uniref:Sorbosone dehydrogenase family protein n=1 Tax=Candidatus Nitrotoga arctica TaxID=453162 RepID=A0ABM8Z0K1_9PROT|nr:PQQ-dependent sugar dehydrogenase [Candidatus Nitrotoga arctica]CAG9933333.1 Sorbosone dehydrogenase family protein [Candidatus Nitrotoga arctica]
MHVPKFSILLLHAPLIFAATLAHAQADATRSPGMPTSDWRSDAPGVRYHIKRSDLPTTVTPTDPEGSVAGVVKVIPPSPGALPKVPEGFAVEVFASGFKQPRTLRVAPNGDIFLSESGTGRVLVFRANASAPAKPEVFAENLDRPYGIVFHPAADPLYVYVAAANQVVRYPYRSGNVKAAGPAEVVIDNIPTKRHWTRDLALSRDGKRLFVSIGSASNSGISMPEMKLEEIRAHEKAQSRGAPWAEEESRAMVRVFDLQGKKLRNYATGLRNCSGLVMQPGTDNLWCVVNERDHLGPFLVPDFMARVKDGDFFGWPWYYLGANEDPAWKGKRPDLKAHVRVPEVLFQAHSAVLSVAFYDHTAFPAEYRGDAFVAMHGSHSRPDRTGYKVVRVRMKNGNPTGEYEDFMTGFFVDNDTVWGRPTGVAVTRDGALLVSDDANGTIFRVTRK